MSGYTPVQRVNELLLASPPDIEGFIDYFFDRFHTLNRSSQRGGAYYVNFYSTCYDCFMPETVELWHYNDVTGICEYHGTRGAHQRYRDFLCHIVENANSYDEDQIDQLVFLLHNVLEENATSIVCYVDFDEDIYDVFVNYDEEDPNDGEISFCKGSRRIAHGGMAISNSRVLGLLQAIKDSDFD